MKNFCCVSVQRTKGDGLASNYVKFIVVYAYVNFHIIYLYEGIFIKPITCLVLIKIGFWGVGGTTRLRNCCTHSQNKIENAICNTRNTICIEKNLHIFLNSDKAVFVFVFSTKCTILSVQWLVSNKLDLLHQQSSFPTRQHLVFLTVSTTVSLHHRSCLT